MGAGVPNFMVRRAGHARPLALPLGELARLKAVTERAGCTRRQFETATLAVDQHRWGVTRFEGGG